MGKHTILSWNLEHMRDGKLRRGDNPARFYSVVKKADLAFFYESKTDCSDGVESILNGGAKAEKAPEVWRAGAETCFGADAERVVYAYRFDRVDSIARNNELQRRIDGVLKTGQRPPVMLDIKFKSFKVTAGAWHAAGPAANTAHDLFDRVRGLDGIDLIFGDFNWQAPPPAQPDALGVQAAFTRARRRSVRLDQKTFLFEAPAPDTNGIGTSTFTAAGPTSRSTALDRCFVHREMRDDVTVKIERFTHPSPWIELTNHYPLFVFLDDGQA